MSGHTPGDWIARPDPHGSPTDFCIGLDDDCSPVDYVAVCRARDARLIAAAPELLDACRGFVEEYGLRCGPADDLDPAAEQAPVVAAAMRAIAKATGEQP